MNLCNSSTYWHHNDLNQIDREGGAGTTLVEGTVDEPAIVEVDVNGDGYQRAAVLSNPGAGNFLFRREVEVDQGLNTIDVRAEDASGNVSPVKNYELTIPAVAKTYEYDLNGNLRFERDSIGSVLRELRWDAQNRLTHVIEGANETEFEYDGMDRRVRIIERVNGVVQDETTYLWADGVILQRRASDAETIERNYYWSGFSEGSDDYFYTRDHLGSVCEVVASDGTTLESRYDYDLWGNVTRIAGTGVESDFRYTGHFYHAPSGLHLAQYRAYDSELGRWLSRDPLGFIDGPNLYQYVQNNPLNLVDHTGLSATSPEPLVMIGEVDLPGGALDRAARIIDAGDRMGVELLNRHQRPGPIRRSLNFCKRNARSLKAWFKSAGFSVRPKPPNPVDQLLSEEGAEAMGAVIELEKRGLRERNQLLANPDCPTALNNYKKRTSVGP